MVGDPSSWAWLVSQLDAVRAATRWGRPALLALLALLSVLLGNSGAFGLHEGL